MLQRQVVEEPLMYEVIKARGTGVFANAHVLTLHPHRISSWLIVINIFLPREPPFNINNQRLRSPVEFDARNIR